MLLNQHIALVADELALIPYREEHVLEYHNWMKDPFLLETTCSEPLSLKEEYEMQKSWQNDPKKLTFIIATNKKESKNSLFGGIIGDVNLYFNDYDDEQACEIEIMIADSNYRRQGYGRKALLMMMDYSKRSLNVCRFVAKVGMENHSSLELFKSLKYTKTEESAIFKQITLELNAPFENCSIKYHSQTYN
jgi:RimJ/RimL family protein N-acetyltransferase